MAAIILAGTPHRAGTSHSMARLTESYALRRPTKHMYSGCPAAKPISSCRLAIYTMSVIDYWGRKPGDFFGSVLACIAVVADSPCDYLE